MVDDLDRYDVVYADPPWYYPATNAWNKTGAASHYDLMTDLEMRAFDMRSWMTRDSALFLWATCPRLDFAIECIRAWGLSYRGVAFVWVKTRRDGEVLGAAGPPPTLVKPVVEVVLAATVVRHGRPFPVDSSIRQVVMAPRREHSRKPDEVADRIVSLCGDRPRVELFARGPRPGWHTWGSEA